MRAVPAFALGAPFHGAMLGALWRVVGCVCLCRAWAWSHWLASSTCALTLAKSTPRKVTMTSWPCRVALSVMLTGASGSGAVGAVWLRWWLAGSVWPLVPASSFALVSSCARLAIAALDAMLAAAVWRLLIVAGSHSAVDDVVGVVPLLWLATFAVPSGNSSTSPVRTSSTALSTRPLHSGSLALAFSAISATASRQACRADYRSQAKKPLPRRTLLLLPLSCPFHTKGLYLAVGSCSSSAAVVFQHDSALFCARPCGVVALSVSLSALS